MLLPSQQSYYRYQYPRAIVLRATLLGTYLIVCYRSRGSLLLYSTREENKQHGPSYSSTYSRQSEAQEKLSTKVALGAIPAGISQSLREENRYTRNDWISHKDTILETKVVIDLLSKFVCF